MTTYDKIENIDSLILNKYLENLEKQCNDTGHDFILHGAMLDWFKEYYFNDKYATVIYDSTQKHIILTTHNDMCYTFDTNLSFVSMKKIYKMIEEVPEIMSSNDEHEREVYIIKYPLHSDIALWHLCTYYKLFSVIFEIDKNGIVLRNFFEIGDWTKTYLVDFSIDKSTTEENVIAIRYDDKNLCDVIQNWREYTYDFESMYIPTDDCEELRNIFKTEFYSLKHITITNKIIISTINYYRRELLKHFVDIKKMFSFESLWIVDECVNYIMQI